MKKFLAALFIFLAGAVFSWLVLNWRSTPGPAIPVIKPRPLDQYTIENLGKRNFVGSEIKTEETLEKNEGFTAYLFSFLSDGKRVTGQINLPIGGTTEKFPVVVMFRGWVNQEVYKIGDGTRKAAAFFAENGFITVAPDFLGYGASDRESSDVMEARFQTYTTALNLIASLQSIKEWNKKDLFIWGHSNGGQIALTVLEVSQKEIPTTLWAPVSKPFPYSVLYYTDESEDRGKLLRRAIAEFEETYDPDLYSLDLYLDRIRAPLQIHQGTADDSVPRDWSDKLVKKLRDLDLDLDYFVYPRADHNLQPASPPASPKRGESQGGPSWNVVVSRDLTFFRKHLK